MKCKLDGENASLLAKAIQSLGKFGADLYVEADAGGLQLRTLNATRSAAGRFRFKRSFFTSFNLAENEECYCRISMKACLAIFRNMRQVEHCELQMLVEESQFHVKLKCHLDTQKNAVIYVVEDENITTAVTPENTANVIYGSYKLFNEISNIFNTTEEEITFEIKKEHLTAKNYIEGARIAEKFMCTQLKLTAEEFDKYDINLETIITFCLKEFRAFLHFAEAINANITLNFEQTGSPIFLFIEKANEIECQLIMSTLAAEDVSYHEEHIDCDLSDADLIAVSESLMDETQSQIETARKRKPEKNNEETSSEVNSAKARRIAEQTTLTAHESLFQFDATKPTTTKTTTKTKTTIERITRSRKLADESGQARAELDELSEPQLERMSPIEELTVGDVQCEIVPTQRSELSVTFFETEDVEKDCIPQSPQQKNTKIRSIFSRCFDATYQPKEPTKDSQIYVPDSDTE